MHPAVWWSLSCWAKVQEREPRQWWRPCGFCQTVSVPPEVHPGGSFMVLSITIYTVLEFGQILTEKTR